MSSPITDAIKYLPLVLLRERRAVSRRQIVQHGKRVFRSMYAGQPFDRSQFRWALYIAGLEIEIAAHVPADQVDEWTMRFRLSADQPMGRQYEGRCNASLANAISKVKRLSPEFYSLPMVPTEYGLQMVEIEHGGRRAEIAQVKHEIALAEKIGSLNPNYLPRLRVKLKLLESLAASPTLEAAE
jgi:hypothetical protein